MHNITELCTICAKQANRLKLSLGGHVRFDKLYSPQIKEKKT